MMLRVSWFIFIFDFFKYHPLGVCSAFLCILFLNSLYMTSVSLCSVFELFLILVNNMSLYPLGISSLLMIYGPYQHGTLLSMLSQRMIFIAELLLLHAMLM